MILKVTKICQGVFSTDHERQRIRKAFRRDPETRRHLMALMDAIEAGQWKKAQRMLDGKWWSGRDKKSECPRAEFIGMLNLQNPENLGHPASGFDAWSDYATLVYTMSRKSEPGRTKFKIEEISEENLSQKEVK